MTAPRRWGPERTADLPMAFSREEFLRGALAAWLWFLLLATAAYAVTFQLIVVVAAVYFVPWSLGALFVGAPFALALGYALRPVRALAAHVAAFAGLGAVIGAAASALLFATSLSSVSGPSSWIVAINIVTAATAVPLGWWWTASRALRADGADTGARVPRRDPDAEYEDRR